LRDGEVELNVEPDVGVDDEGMAGMSKGWLVLRGRICRRCGKRTMKMADPGLMNSVCCDRSIVGGREEKEVRTRRPLVTSSRSTK